MKENRYWLTPPELYKKLNDEFSFDFDPCPFPLHKGYNGLEVDWGQVNYLNPPFMKKDAVGCSVPTAFVHKAIEENKKGKTVVLTLPVASYVNLLVEAGAEIRSLGRVGWLGTELKDPMKSPPPIACFILRGNNKKLL